MIKARTSHSHPLQIAQVRASPTHGRIGITFCPGKHDHLAHTGAWERDLGMDLEAIANWGAKLVITLVESEELKSLKVPHLGEEILRRGIEWRHLPIPDYCVPDDAFEREWLSQGDEIRALLRNGDDVLVHCKGGLGRAGMIAARLLVELGMDPEEAIRRVRGVRKGAIETSSQMALVRRTQTIPPPGGMHSVDTLIDTADMQRVGGALGSNPAGIYQTEDGRRYYVKTLESAAHVRNELIAASLYQLTGAATLNYAKTRSPEQIATEWLELDKKTIAHFTARELKLAQRWFGVHAWTANWDAVGLDGCNQGVAHGKVVTLDLGGALEFRAQGDPKGRAFDRQVHELKRLRSDAGNPHALKLFADMSHEDIQQAISVVTQIPDQQIHQTITAHGGSDKLAEKMIERKADMAVCLKEDKRTKL